MPHKLLLADDSVTIQRVIELTFADEDVQVLTAGDGEEAIASIQSERPDIVLADIGMPKRSGYDVAAFVKNQPGLSHIPVLLLTGAFEPVDERRAQATGCDGVLVKPFEPQQVIARVRELLQGNARGARAGNATRAVSDVPRPAERLSPQRSLPPKRSADATGGDFEFSPGQRDAARGANETSLDAYFDRLDAAFARIASPSDTPDAEPPDAGMRRDGPVMEQELDWFDSPSPRAASAEQASPPSSAVSSEQPSPPTPAASAEHAAPFSSRTAMAEHTLPEGIRPAPPIDSPATYANLPVSPAWPLPQAPPIEPPESPRELAPQSARLAPLVQPPAADTGSAIADAFAALLAVEQGEPGATAVRLAVTSGPPVVTEEFVDEIARRVIERLGSQGSQELVAEVVSRVAERLVREEIERIRSKHS